MSAFYHLRALTNEAEKQYEAVLVELAVARADLVEAKADLADVETELSTLRAAFEAYAATHPNEESAP